MIWLYNAYLINDDSSNLEIQYFGIIRLFENKLKILKDNNINVS